MFVMLKGLQQSSNWWYQEIWTGTIGFIQTTSGPGIQTDLCTRAAFAYFFAHLYQLFFPVLSLSRCVSIPSKYTASVPSILRSWCRLTALYCASYRVVFPFILLTASHFTDAQLRPCLRRGSGPASLPRELHNTLQFNSMRLIVARRCWGAMFWA